MDVAESESSSNAKPKAAPAKKRKRLRKKKVEEDEEYNENKNVAKTIHERFQPRSHKRKDETPMFEVKNGKASIKNSGNHEMTVSRTLDYHMNKLFQWDEQSDAVESAYVCALCHTAGMKRELFGPYYTMHSAAKYWPPFLVRKSNAKKPLKIELWFHGSCALWAPNVHLVGSQLTNLEAQMDIFWSQTCTVCRKTGASIPVQNKKNCFVHYTCAQNKGYNLDEHALLCNS